MNGGANGAALPSPVLPTAFTTRAAFANPYSIGMMPYVLPQHIPQPQQQPMMAPNPLIAGDWLIDWYGPGTRHGFAQVTKPTTPMPMAT